MDVISIGVSATSYCRLEIPVGEGFLVHKGKSLQYLPRNTAHLVFGKRLYMGHVLIQVSVLAILHGDM